LLLVTDLDGTLINSKRAISISAVETVLKFAGKSLDESYFYPYIGIPIKNVLKDLVPEVHLDQSVSFFRSHLAEYGGAQTEVFPGVIEALKELKLKGAVICVASNKVSQLTRIVLDQQGLSSYIEMIYGSDSFPAKPHPGMVIAAMKDYPSNMNFMIGDRPEDIIAGKEAGANTILFSKEYQSQVNKVGLKPDKRVDSWAEVLGFFE
jgi:phosphoglycolate phosphatase